MFVAVQILGIKSHISGFEYALNHRILTLSPLPLRVAKASRNHLNVKITPSFPLGLASDIAKLYKI